MKEMAVEKERKEEKYLEELRDRLAIELKEHLKYYEVKVDIVPETGEIAVEIGILANDISGIARERTRMKVKKRKLAKDKVKEIYNAEYKEVLNRHNEAHALKVEGKLSFHPFTCNAEIEFRPKYAERDGDTAGLSAIIRISSEVKATVNEAVHLANLISAVLLTANNLV